MKKSIFMYCSGLAFLAITAFGLLIPNQASAFSEEGTFISTKCYLWGEYVGPSNNCGPGEGTCQDNTCLDLYGDPTQQ